jgi:glycosyltransferase involved in cell wall biosynthesis
MSSYHALDGDPANSDDSIVKPIVSFGVPVRNGEKYLPRLFDSLLAQNFSAFEVIIGDNRSDDRTEEICRDYAQRDPRIKYFKHPENLGQSGNFNRVFELSQGKYFRWIGDDDWVEPDYTRKCVDFLETHPGFTAVTTEQDHVFDDGTAHYKEYRGERCDSPLPHVRFQRMLWLLTSDFGFIDPMYTLYSREVICQTRKMQLMPGQDHVLAAELSLVSRFGHIPECLAHRRRHTYQQTDRSSLLKHYEPRNVKKIRGHYNIEAARAMWSFVQASPLSAWQKLLCLPSIVRYASIVTQKAIVRQIRSHLRLRSRLLLLYQMTSTLPRRLKY